MSGDWKASVVLITSSDPDKENRFGTGFVIAQDERSTSLLTCTHVVQSIGGPEKMVIEWIQERVIASHLDELTDLAVVHIAKRLDKPPLSMYAAGKKGKRFNTVGLHFQSLTGLFVKRSLSGTLGEQIDLRKRKTSSFKAWDLEITDRHPLQSGYSGSPVVDVNRNVIGVVSTKEGDGKSGIAISIENLPQVWPDMPPDLFLRRRIGPSGRITVPLRPGKRENPPSGKNFPRPPLFRQIRKSVLPDNVLTHAAKDIAPQSSINSPDQSHKKVASFRFFPHSRSTKTEQIHLQSTASPTNSASFAPPPGEQKTPHKPQKRPRSRKKPLLTLFAALLIITLSGILFYADNIYNSIVSNIYTNATVTAAEAMFETTSTADASSIRHADSTADAQYATSTADAIAQAGHPYGGTLMIDDPMRSPGPGFNWQTGNDSYDDTCNFTNDGYHVSGTCNAGEPLGPFIPAKFALELDLTTQQSCGVIDLNFSNGNRNFWIGVCQNGAYILSGDSGSPSGTAFSMHTGTGQTNLIGIVADGANMKLYINRTEVASVSDNAIQAGSLYIGGMDSDVAFLNQASITSKSDYREVVYSNALLWAL